MIVIIWFFIGFLSFLYLTWIHKHYWKKFPKWNVMDYFALAFTLTLTGIIGFVIVYPSRNLFK